ncbi:hypothetical protein [Actinomadura sp. KC345]|uniref:hypothetical protein n=1 Tax=Actinomadura sp. KC345 TaxID=2530371 RepID=UPI0014054AB1|nr:hypothetical protein [Actinomadura sp. KC345]
MSARSKWIPFYVYDVVKVARLPVPNEIRGPKCMIGPKVWVRRHLRRYLPWLVRRQVPRNCCWHHQIDWRIAAAAAIRLVREAQAAGLRGDDIDEFVMDRLADQDLGDQAESAVIALTCTGAGIQLAEPDAPWRYFEGQHRVAAQLDQGVRETIVQRLELLDPDTGQLFQD